MTRRRAPSVAQTATIPTTRRRRHNRRREWRDPSPFPTPRCCTPDSRTSPGRTPLTRTTTGARQATTTTTMTARTANTSAPRRASASRRRSSTTPCRQSVRSSRRFVRSNFPLRQNAASKSLVFSLLPKYIHKVCIRALSKFYGPARPGRVGFHVNRHSSYFLNKILDTPLRRWFCRAQHSRARLRHRCRRSSVRLSVRPFPLRCTNCNSSPISGQRTNFKLFDLAL